MAIIRFFLMILNGKSDDFHHFTTDKVLKCWGVQLNLTTY